MTIHEKLSRLKERLRRERPLAVSFSGGVDSLLLLAVATEVLGPEGVLAVTAKAINFPEREHREAVELAKSLGVRHIILDFDVMKVPGFVENSPERCYHCKKSLFEAVLTAAREHGVTVVADGANVDDAGDYRPGMRATGELGVISPLRDAGLGKSEIRCLLRELSLPDGDKPSLACLASRIPYGLAIDESALARVDKAETFLLGQGFRNVRVRHHGDLARIEVEPDERRRLLTPDLAQKIDEFLRDLGYTYVTLDLRGYRTGSMNEGLAG